MSWFRLEGHLRIAEHGRDKSAIDRIATELDAATRRRTELRLELKRHKQTEHFGGSGAAPLTMRA